MTDDERPIELSEGEVEALAALPRERAPRAELEELTLTRLRQEGLVTGGTALWKRNLLVLAASVLLLMIGFAGGRLLSSLGPPSLEEGERYLLVLYRSPDELTDPEGEEARVEEYSAWARDLAERGRLLGGEPLASEGQLLIPTADGIDRLAQSSVAGEEPMTGYFLISAASRAEAERVALECPHLAHGGKVMLRRIGHTAR